jgi:class 3 adenylate cyclase
MTQMDSNLTPAVAMRTAQVVHIEDLTDTDLYRQGDPGRVAMVEAEGMRTILGVPLLRGTEAIGCITLFRREVKAFTDDEIALVETFAEQAVIAIENVRQFREVQTRLEREQASREVLQIISQSRDDEMPVFNSILERAARLCDAQAAGFQLANDAGTHLQLMCNWGVSKGVIKPGFQIPMDSQMDLAVAVREGHVINIGDLKETAFYKQGLPERVQLVDGEGVRSWLIVPLLRDGVGFGSMTLSRHDVKPFSSDEIALVETFAAQAAIAVENVRQFKALESRTAEVESLNSDLEQRVETQVDQLERLGRLKRFLSPQVADAVISTGDESLLGSHRALIAILFCDIRGFTAFCETAEPEEAIEVLQTYHEAMGALIAEHGAGVDTRAGDGIMVIFNDPLPCDDPTGDALRLGFAMRARMDELCRGWKRLGHRLGFGVGIALGYATVGMVGSAGRYDYTASGTAVNLAARLCDQAGDGDILLSPRAFAAVEDVVRAEPVGEVTLKGIHAPVEVFRALSVDTSPG